MFPILNWNNLSWGKAIRPILEGYWNINYYCMFLQIHFRLWNKWLHPLINRLNKQFLGCMYITQTITAFLMIHVFNIYLELDLGIVLFKLWRFWSYKKCYQYYELNVLVLNAYTLLCIYISLNIRHYFDFCCNNQ